MKGILLLLGFFVWIVATIYKVVLTPKPLPILHKLWRSVMISQNSWGIELTLSVFQVISYFWLIMGFLINIIGENVIKGLTGSLIIAGIILLPIWVFAAIFEKKRRQKK